jgi:predicted DNA binding CopG/RHH family protein
MSYKHDEDEKEIINSVTRGEWKSVRNLKNEIQRLKKFAHATVKKNKRVNIRLSSVDLEGIQSKALEEGIPYQTLMSSVLHKFVIGNLVEKRGAMK